MAGLDLNMPPATVLAIEHLTVDVIVKVKLYGRLLLAILTVEFFRHGCNP
ncbi:hypothetical protein ACIQUS_09740 [Pseudomonas sp. NPDC090755]